MNYIDLVNQCVMISKHYQSKGQTDLGKTKSSEYFYGHIDECTDVPLDKIEKIHNSREYKKHKNPVFYNSFNSY